MIGVIKVLTTDDRASIEQHGKTIERVSGIPTRCACIPDQPLGIFDDASQARGVPKIVTLGEELEEEGCRLIVVSCAADPGVAELRQKVKIPVIGAGSAGAYTALQLGIPVGVLGIGEQTPAVIEKILGKQIVGYVRPQGITNATALYTPTGLEKGLQAVRELLDMGAQGIVFGCTGYSAIGLKSVLQSEFKLPIIDGVEASGMLAAFYLRQIVSEN